MSEAILVVDDDASIRRLLERTLVAEGYRVEGVADGGAALAAIERSVPDLIILDLGLPGMNGVEVSRRVRARGLATPILMLTARDAMADRVEGLDAGADDYVVKPFDADELHARTRALLRRGREPAELLASAVCAGGASGPSQETSPRSPRPDRNDATGLELWSIRLVDTLGSKRFDTDRGSDD